MPEAKIEIVAGQYWFLENGSVAVVISPGPKGYWLCNVVTKDGHVHMEIGMAIAQFDTVTDKNCATAHATTLLERKLKNTVFCLG